MTEKAGRTAAVFVDRDGTLIRDVGHLRRPDQIELLPRVPEAIQRLRQQELRVVVLTNQSGVARGLVSEADLEPIHRELEQQLAAQGAVLDGIYYCPHHPSEGLDPYRVSCECRKPKDGMARRAAAELMLDLSRSYVVGDQPSDMELASRIGGKGIRIREGNRQQAIGNKAEEGTEFLVVKDLWEAAQWIMRDFQAKMTGRE